MREERLEVSVTFDERGYIGSAPERAPEHGLCQQAEIGVQPECSWSFSLRRTIVRDRAAVAKRPGQFQLLLFRLTATRQG
jgi:hypothetical protein